MWPRNLHSHGRARRLTNALRRTKSECTLDPLLSRAVVESSASRSPTPKIYISCLLTHLQPIPDLNRSTRLLLSYRDELPSVPTLTLRISMFDNDNEPFPPPPIADARQA